MGTHVPYYEINKNNSIKGFLGHYICEIRRSFLIVLASIFQQFWVLEKRAKLFYTRQT